MFAMDDDTPELHTCQLDVPQSPGRDALASTRDRRNPGHGTRVDIPEVLIMRTIAAVLLIGAGFAVGSFAQASATVTSSISPTGEVRVTIGVFLFEQGQKLALELTGEDPCPCACGTIIVESFSVLREDGTVIYIDETFSYPTSSEAWIGRWDLVAADGEPAPNEQYTALVSTSIGEFRAVLQVTAHGESAPLRRVSAEATVCGVGLRVYRLLTADDDGVSVQVTEDGRLLVALAGNPTTGFGWEVEEEPGFLTRLAGLVYLPDSGLLGAGGTFFFRYEATATGTGTLSLSYRRPWEALPPEQTFTFRIAVR